MKRFRFEYFDPINDKILTYFIEANNILEATKLLEESFPNNNYKFRQVYEVQKG